jgi:LacI family transcriptional regulator
MKKRVRIKDIANKVGVSTGTVDRVLHNRGNVAADVKKKILEAIEELEYERNHLASALAYNRTFKVTALLPNPKSDHYWKAPNKGVLKAAKSVKHYGLILDIVYFDLFDTKGFVHSALKVLEGKPSALLFPPLFVKEAKWLIEKCEEVNIPYVTFNTELKGTNYLCYIGQDSYQSGVLGARLLNFGVNEDETVCILNLDYSTKAAYHLLEKERGFNDYFTSNKRNKIKILKESFESFNDSNLLQAFLKDLLEKHPKLNGIFVTNSRAYKVVNCLKKITDRSIKIVGFDLVDENLKYLQENKIDFLINQNPNEQGYLSVMSIFKHLVLKEKVEKIQHLPLDIVVKENVKHYLIKQDMVNIVL